jgi:hypothetical protein
MTRRTGAGVGCYVWRPPDHATASVAVQSRWGNLYEAPATIRSLAVDAGRHVQVFAEIAAPAAGPVADRLPGRSLRLRVPGVPAVPFGGPCRVLLSLGEVTDLVSAHVVLAPGPGPAGDGMRVLVTAAAPGELFGLARAQAGPPRNAVRRAARTVRLLVDAAVTGDGGHRPGTRAGDFD